MSHFIKTLCMSMALGIGLVGFQAHAIFVPEEM